MNISVQLTLNTDQYDDHYFVNDEDELIMCAPCAAELFNFEDDEITLHLTDEDERNEDAYFVVLGEDHGEGDTSVYEGDDATSPVLDKFTTYPGLDRLLMRFPDNSAFISVTEGHDG